MTEIKIYNLDDTHNDRDDQSVNSESLMINLEPEDVNKIVGGSMVTLGTGSMVTLGTGSMVTLGTGSMVTLGEGLDLIK